MIKELAKEVAKTILLCVVLLLWALLMFHFEPWAVIRDEVITRQDSYQDESTRLYGEGTIQQRFRADRAFNTIEVQLSNDGVEEPGSLYINLYAQNDGRLLGEWRIEWAENTQDWLDWLELKLPEQAEGGGTEYELLLTAPGVEEEEALLLGVRHSSIGDGGELWINGEKQEDTLSFSVSQAYPNTFARIALIVFVVTVEIWWLLRGAPLRKTAPILLLGMGLCMQIALAPFAAPDDRYHYNSSLVLSNILMGRNDPYTIEEEYDNFDGLRLHRNAESAFVRMVEDFQTPKKVDSRLGTIEDWDAMDAKLMHPIKYLPQAAGLSLARVLGLNFSYAFFFGRLFNLLAYVCLVSAAIAIIPQYQELLLLFALLPMNLQQATSYSRDTMMIACIIFFVALVVKLWRQEKRASMLDALALGLSAGVFIPIKAVYMPLLLLLFAIPGKRFVNKKHHAAFLALAFLLPMLFFAFANTGLIRSTREDFRQYARETSGEMLDEETIVKLKAEEDEAPEKEAQTTYALSDIVDNPTGFVKKLIGTVYKNVYELTLMAGGSKLAGVNLEVEPQFLVGMWFLFFLSAICLKKGETPLRAWERAVILSACLLVTIAVFAGAFQWTPIGYDYIMGVQGRYFLPAALPALLCLKTGRRTSTSNATMIIGAYCFFQLGVLHDILSTVVT